MQPIHRITSVHELFDHPGQPTGSIILDAVEHSLSQTNLVTAKEVADHVGAPVRVLTGVTKLLTGQYLCDLIEDYRLLEIARRLQQTDLTLDAIAEGSGYSERTTLERIFARRVGMSPSHWRDLSKLRQVSAADILSLKKAKANKGREANHSKYR